MSTYANVIKSVRNVKWNADHQIEWFEKKIPDHRHTWRCGTRWTKCPERLADRERNLSLACEIIEREMTGGSVVGTIQAIDTLRGEPYVRDTDLDFRLLRFQSELRDGSGTSILYEGRSAEVPHRTPQLA